MVQHDLLIVGAGPVGLSLALALKDSGLAIALADARPRDAVAADPRALALAHGTRLTLERLGVWHDLPATPIRHIHISQQGGLGRTRLEADEYGLPALGYVVRAGALADVLREALERTGITVMDETEVAGLATGSDAVTASLAGSGSTLHGAAANARLVACAEGGLQAGTPDIVERDYGQHAIIADVGIAGGHDETAFERFTSEGPIALLPHGHQYALVHVASPRRATELLALSDAAYLEHLQHRFGSRVHLAHVAGRQRYPLVLRYRRDPVGQRTVWLGNAAQTLHPVAGQGFNLALRDVWALASTLLDFRGDPGLAGTLAAWRDARRLDRFGAINFTDSLVRIFSNDFAPLHHARGAALFALDMLPPLRHFIARRMMFGARAWP
ncbi:FAD-dependent monooxygenase [Aromatoleum petrolei]|uniref:2-octaprenyl-6-methoxyphenyl hydroxylase n=1 Tax=Aromatoleum petrolei TaxID=76116 RepID=A0ABX1MII9_9RHOO|nr:FAD-dependent monooxygenase [Aromatoleum petrolei]NMF86976.1 2-octaprenyl-6-methoxyphenyl hydroxylase [Aromatoleum petrolei]QTQ37571.1 Putative 2-octaprenyl-6-methoxyphenol hydroxylase [Aromatoleum petrolei]